MALFNINVTGYENKPPTIGDGERNTNYGEAITLTRADFTTNTTPPYYDPEGDLPLNLKVLSLPAGGILRLNGVDVVVNQELSFINDIDTGLFTYTPDLNNTAAHSVNFNFSISDVGSGTYVS
jgi:hypothetical protein